MKGWKTWLGALGLIGHGLWMGFVQQDWTTASQNFAEAIVIIGIGHKIEKNR